MKYSILDFNQAEVIKLSNIDVEDLLLLQYIKEAIASPSMDHKLNNGKYYVWLNHSKILKDLPILNIKESRLHQKLKKLIELDLIDNLNITEKGLKGTKAYYTITSKCEQLYYTSEPPVKNSTWLEEPPVKNSTSYNTSNNKFLGSIKSISKQNKQKDIDRYIELYRQHCTNFQQIRKLTETRKHKILSLLEEYTWDEIIEAFDNANESDFLQGRCGGTWKADFDFFLKKDKFPLILEGKYGGHTEKRAADGLKIGKKATKEEIENEYIYKF